MQKALLIGISLTLFVVSGCAKRASSISPATFPVSAYENMNCQQLANELEQERAKLDSVSKEQNRAATVDAVGVFLVLIPAGSLVGGDKEGEVATLKGKVVSIEAAIKSNEC